MTTIQTVVLVAHTFIAVMIIVLVLLQRGKGAEAGAAFGAGASGTVFGARGSTSFFSRATAILATAFFASSLALAYLSSQASAVPDSLIEGAPAIEETTDAAGDDLTEGDVPELPVSEDAGAADSDVPVLEPETPDDDGQTPE